MASLVKTTITGTALANSPVLAINSGSSGSYLHMLEAFSSSMASGNTNILVFGSAGSTGNSAYIGYRSYGANNANNVLTLGHWGHNHLINIKRDGNVGIGTTNPSQKLHVNGNITVNAQVIFSSGSNQYLEIGTNSIALKNSGGNVLWNSATALDSSTAWANMGAGTRTNYTLKFKPPGSSYAGFQFDGTDGNYAGFFLIRGTSDSDVYTAEGITLVADQGWLTLAQRTASSKGVKIMTGSSTSRDRITVSSAGDIVLGVPTNSLGTATTTTLKGYSVQYDSGGAGARLSNTGFLTWHTGGGWTSNERMWSFTNAYNISGSAGPRFTLLRGNANNVVPTLGNNGSFGTNTLLTCYWSKDGDFHNAGPVSIVTQTLPSSNNFHVSSGSSGSASKSSIAVVSVADNSTFNNGTAALHVINSGNRGTAGNSSGSDLLRLEFSNGIHTIFNKDGSVGIGTTNPSYDLDVNGDVRARSDLYIGTGGGHFYSDSGSRIRTNQDFYTNNSSTYLYGDNTYLGASSGDVIHVRDNSFRVRQVRAYNGNGIQFQDDSGTEYMRLRDGGNVGIGINLPEYRLHVSATSTTLAMFDGGNANNWVAINSGNGYSAGVKYLNAGTAKWFVGHYNGAPGGFSFYDASTSAVKLYIEEGGNVGIGTTDPGAGLEVLGNAIIGSAATKLRTYSDSVYSGIYNGSALGSDESIYFGSGTIYFKANATSMLTITSGAVYPGTSNGTKDLGLSGNRWNNVYSEAGNFSGTVTAAAFSGTADKSNMVTGSAFATTGSPGSVLEYQQAASITDTKLAPTTDWYNTIRMGHGNPYTYYSNTIAMQMTGTGAGQIRTQWIANGTAQGWRTVWDSGNDGSGSGLDADLLDGQHGSHYLAAANLTGTVPVAVMNKVLPTSGNYVWSNSTTAGNYTTGLQLAFVRGAEGWPNYGSVLHVGARGGTDAGGDFQIYCGHGSANGGNYLRVRNADNNANPTDSWTDWRTIWDSGNDGSGSGLDADKLDGLEYNHFAYRASGGTGYYIVSSWLQFSGTYGPYWNAGVGAGWHIYPASTDSMRWRASSSAVRSNLRLDVGSSNYGNLCASTTMGYGLRGAGVTLSTDSDWDLLINTDGNVGIGTTQPSQKLDVNGNTELNGSVNLTGGNWLSFDGEQVLRKSSNWLYLADGGFTSGLYTRIKIRVDGYDISPYQATASVTSATTLGLSTNRWYNVYSQAGNFSGTVTAGGIALGAGNLTTTGNISGNGSGLTALNASNIGSGTVPAARLGSGSSITTKFLRGDNTWQTVSSGSNPNNATITLSAGTNLSGGGNFTTNQSSNETITFNMATGGFGAGTYGSTSDSSKIDQITLDAYGRVTNITTGGTGAGDITAVNVGGALSGGGSSGSVTVSLGNAGAGAGTYGDTSNSVKIDQITLDQYGRVTNITTGATGSGSMSSWNWGISGSTTSISQGETVRILAGTNVTVSRSGNDVTVNASGGGSTPNNKTITLSAGTGLSNGGAFTTNQSFNETITFNVDGTVCRGVSAPSGSATPSSGSFDFLQSGGITISASGNNITFSSSSSSDYRLKKNITDFNSESWTKVKSVSCRKFDFDAEKFAQAMEDDYTIPRPASYGGRIGFIAHELEALGIDGAVEGVKDGVDENGVPIYQKVSYTTLVPVLWGALNEAIRKIEILESKVQALEDSS